VWHAHSLEDKVINSYGCGGDLTAGIAKLSNWLEWLSGEGGHDVGLTGWHMAIQGC